MLRSLLLIAALVACVHAHNGAFHDTTPETGHHIRIKAAFCSRFVPFTAAQLAAAKAANGTAVERQVVSAKAAPAGVAIAGNGTVWQYLYKNKTCSLSGGIQLHAVFTQNGRPLSNFSTTGRTHTAKCSEGAGARFYFNITGNLTDPGNPLWWYGGVTNKTGAALGNGANDGTIDLSSPNAPRSLVVYDDKSGAPFACCDLAPQYPLNTDFPKLLKANKGAVACTDEDLHAGHGAPAAAHGAPAAAAKTAAARLPAAPAAAAPMAMDEHAGHNMNRRLLGGAFAAAWNALLA